jgi:internalin A
LAEAFNPRADGEGAAEYTAKITEEANCLRRSDSELLSLMIREMIRNRLEQAVARPERLLLYVDQWEELYAQVPSSVDTELGAQHTADVKRFIDLLLTAARTAPVVVVATVRADFYASLIGNPEIRSLLPTRQVLLGSMRRSELESTIVEPARKVGLVFDPPSLVQRILDEAGQDGGVLPLLQYALKEAWALREGRALTSHSYERSGGIREAIRITADRTFEALSAEGQRAARRLFLRLVMPGEGYDDTRARVPMPSESAQRKIVEQFVAPRTPLLATGLDDAGRPTVEFAHEAVIRTWPRLRLWIDANRVKLRARMRVLQAKADWEENERREDMLLPGGLQLERARSLLGDPRDIPTDDIEEFVALSIVREGTRIGKERESALARMSVLTAKPEYFVSYAWGDHTLEGLAREDIVDRLCEAAEKRGISILRDKKMLGLGERISKFMERLGRGSRVFIVLSNKYLQSPYCMYELASVWRNCRQDDEEFLRCIRVFALGDAKIWTPRDRALCAAYWRNESGQLEAIVRKHGYDILGEKDFERYRLMKEFAHQIGNILGTVTDILQPRTFEELERYGFADPPEKEPDGNG